MHSCTHWLRPRTRLPPHLGSYTRALLVRQDRRQLFMTTYGLHSLYPKNSWFLDNTKLIPNLYLPSILRLFQWSRMGKMFNFRTNIDLAVPNLKNIFFNDCRLESRSGKSSTYPQKHLLILRLFLGRLVRRLFHLPSKTATLRLFLGRLVRRLFHLPSKTATLRLFLGRLVRRLFLRSTDWRFWRPPKIPEPKSAMRFPFRFTTSRESYETKYVP